MYVMYYASMHWCWQLVWILVKTNHPCLRVRRHGWYQSRMSIIWHWRSYFWKSTVSICFNAHIRTIIVLTGDKLTGIYFLQFTFCNDTPMPRQEGKSHPAGWCESRTRPLKTRLLEDSPYRAIEIVVHHVTSHDRVPRVSRDLGLSCGHFRKTWIRSFDICSVVHTALNVWAPLGG
jgi:hypothetical protein